MVYLLYWAAPLLVAIGLLTGAFRATRSVAAAVLVIVALMVWAAIDGRAAKARGVYCDSLDACLDFSEASVAGAAFIAVIVVPHLFARGLRNWVAWLRARESSDAGDIPESRG